MMKNEELLRKTVRVPNMSYITNPSGSVDAVVNGVVVGLIAYDDSEDHTYVLVNTDMADPYTKDPLDWQNVTSTVWPYGVEELIMGDSE